MRVKRTREKRVVVYYDHEDIEKILIAHAAAAADMSPDDCANVQLEGGDGLCRASVAFRQETEE